MIDPIETGEIVRRLERAERQRDILAETLRSITRLVPIMTSAGEYKRGQLHALESCSNIARAALAQLETP